MALTSQRQAYEVRDPEDRGAVLAELLAQALEGLGQGQDFVRSRLERAVKLTGGAADPWATEAEGLRHARSDLAWSRPIEVAAQTPHPIVMASPKAEANQRVYVIDDDVQLCDAISSLLRSAGLHVSTFSSPKAFSERLQTNDRGCLLLDIHFPDTCGLDFQSRLRADGVAMPVIMMSGRSDVASSVRSMKSGATDFLIKPFRDGEVIAAVRAALAREQQLWAARAEAADAVDRYDSLTAREKQVLDLVTAGLMNKQAAAELNLSEITVKIHRGTMMRKMGVRTLADLVRMSEAVKSSRGYAQGWS